MLGATIQEGEKHHSSKIVNNSSKKRQKLEKIDENSKNKHIDHTGDQRRTIQH